MTHPRLAEPAPARVGRLASNGIRTYAAPVGFPVGDRPSVVGVGDFDRDGRLDLAVVNTLANKISVLLNRGCQESS